MTDLRMSNTADTADTADTAYRRAFSRLPKTERGRSAITMLHGIFDAIDEARNARCGAYSRQLVAGELG